MAVIKHVASKNADYGAAERYLIYQHDEFTNKPVLDEQGRRIPREGYLIDGLNCSAETFAIECLRLNKQFHKNNTRAEIKSHHYIISFDPRDRDENGLTPEKAQQLGLEYAAKNFPGHQAIVCTHPDGHNSSGNIHVHIVINSLRKLDVERQDFMERPCDCLAGNKHHLTKGYLEYLKQETMAMCQQEELYQVDLLTPAKVHVSENEYWAKRKGQIALDERNQQMQAEGLTPKTTVFETQKDLLRRAITQTMLQSRTLEDFQKILMEQYGVQVKESRGRFSYLHPDRPKPITGRKLGTDFEKEVIEQYIATHEAQHIELNAKEQKTHAPVKKPRKKPMCDDKSIRLIVDLSNCMKAQENRFYAQKVKVGNLQQMAKTISYLQEHQLGTIEALHAAVADCQTVYDSTLSELKATEQQLKAVNSLIHYTGQYFGNKKVWETYQKAKNKPEFLEAHRSEIMLFEAARAALKEAQGSGKLPSLKTLKAQKEELVKKKNECYETYSFAKAKRKELQTVQSNIDAILNTTELEKEPTSKDRS